MANEVLSAGETTAVTSSELKYSPEEIERALAVARSQLDGRGAGYLTMKGLPAHRNTFTTEAQVRQRIEKNAGDAQVIVRDLLRIDDALNRQ